MKKIYKAEFKCQEIYIVCEDDNTIGYVFNNIEDAISFSKGFISSTTLLSVNNELLCFGVTVGFFSNISLIDDPFNEKD